MTHTYRLIDAKISMKVRKKNEEKKGIIRWLVFVCLFFFVF